MIIEIPNCGFQFLVRHGNNHLHKVQHIGKLLLVTIGVKTR